MPAVTLFTYDFDWAAAHDVLGAWQRWTAAVNDAVWSNCQLLSGAGTPSVRVAGVACATVAQTAAWLAPLLGRGPPDLLVRRRRGVPARDDGRGRLRGAQRRGVPPRHAPARACCRARPSSPRRTTSRPRWATRGSPRSSRSSTTSPPRSPSLGGGLVFDALGGGSTQVPATATAFVHRDFLARSSRRSTGRRATPSSQVRAGPAWLAHVRDAVYDAVDRRVPELHRPDAQRLAERLLRGEPGAAAVRQARGRPRRRVPLRPVDPARCVSARRSAGRHRAGGARAAAAAASPGPSRATSRSSTARAVRLVDVAAVLELRRHVARRAARARGSPRAARRCSTAGSATSTSGWSAPSWRRSSVGELVGVLDHVDGAGELDGGVVGGGDPEARVLAVDRLPRSTARTPSRRRPTSTATRPLGERGEHRVRRRHVAEHLVAVEHELGGDDDGHRSRSRPGRHEVAEALRGDERRATPRRRAVGRRPARARDHRRTHAARWLRRRWRRARAWSAARRRRRGRRRRTPSAAGSCAPRRRPRAAGPATRRGARRARPSGCRRTTR